MHVVVFSMWRWCLIAVVLMTALEVEGHGYLTNPPQRGYFDDPSSTTKPYDIRRHYPAGDKSDAKGSGRRSQERAGNYNWTPFKPLSRGFKWRAGVCGDPKPSGPNDNSQEHMRGGKFYGGGEVVRTYRENGILEMSMEVIEHHNGFVELHVCDVEKCGGEISVACFQAGHCKQLQRTYNQICETRSNLQCAPRDPAYPGRWYLPCRRDVKVHKFGGPTARFRLPPGLTCDHCVLHWFWTTANNCNPPGVVDFFQGPRGPRWNSCEGQGGAVGGFAAKQLSCGSSVFAEEYYSCADIAITANGRSNPTPSTSTPDSPPPSPAQSGTGPITSVNLFADGKRRTRLVAGTQPMTIAVGAYRRLTFEAVLNRSVRRVDFIIDGSLTSRQGRSPFFMFGNAGAGPRYWPARRVIYNREFELEVKVPGGEFRTRVVLKR